MTTTVTVKTAGHIAFVETSDSYPNYTTKQIIMLPRTVREFIVSDSSITIEERPVELVKPENTHASVV
jgi:hypothetical protein